MAFLNLSMILCLLVVLYFSAKFYLLMRQKASLQNISAVPMQLLEKFTEEEKKKGIAYQTARLSYSQFQLLVSFFTFVAWIVFGLPWIEGLALSFSSSLFVQSLLVFASYSVIENILSLPFSYYSHFVIEAKYGFNKMTFTLFVADALKKIFLSALIGLPLISLLLWLVLNIAPWSPYFFVAFLSFQFLLVWIYPQFIAPLFNKFSSLEDQHLKQGIESLLSQTGGKLKEVLVMDASKRSSHGNAYFTGLGKTKRVVFYDTLLKDLTTNQILAVLAHELGHMKLNHIRNSLILSFFMSAVMLFGLELILKTDLLWIHWPIFTPQLLATKLLLLSLISGLIFFWSSPFGSWLSRRNEFAADKFAAGLTDAQDLVSALVNMSKSNAVTLKPDALYALFYYSHPPLIERVAHLSSLSK